MIYELWIGDVKVDSNAKKEPLLKKANEQTKYWRIFMVFKSSMHEHSLLKMNIQDMREANRMNERGYEPKIIARKFGVSKDYMLKVLRQVKSETQ